MEGIFMAVGRSGGRLGVASQPNSPNRLAACWFVLQRGSTVATTRVSSNEGGSSAGADTRPHRQLVSLQVFRAPPHLPFCGDYPPPQLAPPDPVSLRGERRRWLGADAARTPPPQEKGYFKQIMQRWDRVGPGRQERARDATADRGA